LNILIGANGSGKTNLINVLNFFKHSVIAVDDSPGMTAYEQAVINQLGGAKLLDSKLALPANASYLFEFADSDPIPSTTFSLTLHVKDAIILTNSHKASVESISFAYGPNQIPFIDMR
jgi:energy-coupling factor transporter ATP-binding protein EcfA2